MKPEIFTKDFGSGLDVVCPTCGEFSADEIWRKSEKRVEGTDIIEPLLYWAVCPECKSLISVKLERVERLIGGGKDDQA